VAGRPLGLRKAEKTVRLYLREWGAFDLLGETAAIGFEMQRPLERDVGTSSKKFVRSVLVVPLRLVAPWSPIRPA
jgi:hypothetical protein